MIGQGGLAVGSAAALYHSVKLELEDKPTGELESLVEELRPKVKRDSVLLGAGVAVFLGSFVGSAIARAIPGLEDQAMTGFYNIGLPSLLFNYIYFLASVGSEWGLERRYRMSAARNIMEERKR